MKSVGETMAIGRNFKESLQKALVSLETGLEGLDKIDNLSKNEILKKLGKNKPNKILLIAEAIRNKINPNKIYSKTKIDKWFIEQIKEIVDIENILIKHGFPKTSNELNYVKSIGFSDKKISELTRKSNRRCKNSKRKTWCHCSLQKNRYMCCRIQILNTLYVFYLSKRYDWIFNL